MLWASFRGLGQALLKPLDHGDTVTKFGNALGWLFFLLSGGFLLVLGLAGLMAVWMGTFVVACEYWALQTPREMADGDAETAAMAGNNEEV